MLHLRCAGRTAAIYVRAGIRQRIVDGEKYVGIELFAKISVFP